MVARLPSAAIFLASIRNTFITESTPAPLAFFSVRATQAGSISEAYTRKSFSISPSIASSLASRQISFPMKGNASAAKCLFLPGAIFFISIAASIAIVPLPHIGSQRRTFSRGREVAAIAQARVSLMGAAFASRR